MLPTASPRPQATSTGTVGSQQTSTIKPTQTELLAKIGTFSDRLLSLDPHNEKAKGELIRDFHQLCNDIDRAKDAGHYSDFLGLDNKSENYIRLETMLDQKILDERNPGLRDELFEVLGNELDSVNSREIHDKLSTRETEILGKLINHKSKAGVHAQFLTNGLAPTDRSIVNYQPKSKEVIIGNQKFTIEKTQSSANGSPKNDCLAYATLGKNETLTPDYRKLIFTADNIEEQLKRMVLKGKQDNRLVNPKTGDFADLDKDIECNEQDLEILKVACEAYPEAASKLSEAGSIRQFAAALSNTIATSNCMLDHQIAAGVMARHKKQPLVIMTEKSNASTEKNEQSYTVFNKFGTAVYSGIFLRNVPPETLQNAMYIQHTGKAHFNRMTRVAGSVPPTVQSANANPALKSSPFTSSPFTSSPFTTSLTDRIPPPKSQHQQIPTVASEPKNRSAEVEDGDLSMYSS